jgi:hypothetical protein
MTMPGWFNAVLSLLVAVMSTSVKHGQPDRERTARCRRKIVGVNQILGRII